VAETKQEAAYRLDITPVPNITGRSVKKNRAYTFYKEFKAAEWSVYTKPRCAVVGGGRSVKEYLGTLKKWDTDVYAINDAAGYLSDNGISCYIYSIDGSEIPFKTGENVKGALFSRRVHKVQFDQFEDKDIRVFEMLEDVDDPEEGIEGGLSALCRAPHLFIKMGYAGVDFFGCEGSFFGDSHNSGDHDDAHSSKVIVRVKGVDYVTSCAFLLQNQYMAPLLSDDRMKKFFKSHSGGLLQAMIDNPKTWSVVAISDEIKRQGEAQGLVYIDPYKSESPVWQP